MIVWRVLAGAAVLALGACSSNDQPWQSQKISVDMVRQGAAKAGPSPAVCPIELDVPAALRSAGVDQAAKLDTAEASASKTDKPAANPVVAQQKGMSALDASAGAEIECHYRIGDDVLDVYLVVTRSKGAASLLGPMIARDAHLKLSDLPKFIAPGPGEVKVAAGSVAVGGLAAEGGDAAMVVSSTASKVHGDTLRSVASTLIGTVAF